jgi:hypothetical protein
MVIKFISRYNNGYNKIIYINNVFYSFNNFCVYIKGLIDNHTNTPATLIGDNFKLKEGADSIIKTYLYSDCVVAHKKMLGVTFFSIITKRKKVVSYVYIKNCLYPIYNDHFYNEFYQNEIGSVKKELFNEIKEKLLLAKI